jgi:hypothetical protein
VKVLLLIVLGGAAAIGAALAVKSKDEIARYRDIRKM